MVNKRVKKGFTLIEILIVVAIIGLIASLVAPNLMGRFDKSKEEMGKVQLEMLSTAVTSFMVDVGRCPQDLNELISSTDKKWRGPYLGKNEIPLDPWGRPFQFKCPGEHNKFDLYSLGPNNQLDDRAIKNW